jgi:hypothetical protein
MNAKFAILLLTISSVIACTPEPVKDPPPPPPPAVKPFYALEFSPNASTFNLSRGETKTITIQTSLLSPGINSVGLSIVNSDVNLVFSKLESKVSNNGSWSFDVRLAANAPIPVAPDVYKPYFYVYDTGYDQNNNPLAGIQIRQKFQWLVANPVTP